MMVAIPELDGATWPMMFGGRSRSRAPAIARSRHGALHPRARGDAGGARRQAGRAAPHRARRAQGRDRAVQLPAECRQHRHRRLSVGLRVAAQHAARAEGERLHASRCRPTSTRCATRILDGNAARFGADANVARPHPGRRPCPPRALAAPRSRRSGARRPAASRATARSIFVLGERFGNVFVGIQPAFGYEGDPMRLLFEKGFAPTHAFSAFYRWLREDFGAHAVLHFGTHGALEFMPGKQAGLSGECWPDRLIGDLPNFYLYASNNPSEGAIAKRRAGATLISYLTPPVAQAGLYRGLLDLKASIDRWRGAGARCRCRAARDAGDADPGAGRGGRSRASRAGLGRRRRTPRSHALHRRVLELEYTLIPHGLHVVGEPPDAAAARRDARCRRRRPSRQRRAAARCAARAGSRDCRRSCTRSTAAIIRPAPGGDLLRTPDVLPTGRNLHGFDPFRIPSAFAVQDGARQADRLLARHAPDGHGAAGDGRDGAVGHRQSEDRRRPDRPGAVADGRRAALRQLWPPRRRGARSRSTSSAGRASTWWSRCRASSATCCRCRPSCWPRPRCWRRSADEPVEQNFVRKHALAFQAAHGGDLEQAALRVFGNADGAYGANVNQLVDSGGWDDEDELAETYRAPQGLRLRRRRPAGAAGGACSPTCSRSVDLAYQNLDSVELGVTTVDHYFDTLGGISRAVRRARGSRAPRLYRRPDARRRHGAHAVASRSRSRPAPACSIRNGTRAAEARLRGRAPDRGARHQHAWAGRRPPARSRPGSTSS